MYLLKARSHMLLHRGRHNCFVFSMPSSGYGFSSFPVQTLGLWSFTEIAECLDDFETIPGCSWFRATRSGNMVCLSDWSHKYGSQALRHLTYNRSAHCTQLSDQSPVGLYFFNPCVLIYIHCPVLRKTWRFVQPRKFMSPEGESIVWRRGVLARFIMLIPWL